MDTRTVPTAISLWNPSIAIALSLLFSPVFGAYIVAKNWEKLGLHNRFTRSMLWAYGGAGGFLVDLHFFAGRGKFIPAGHLIFVLWALFNGLSQVLYFRRELHNKYLAKGWMEPVLMALTVILLIAAVAVLSSGLIDSIFS
jgi:hypothetical protein